MFIIYTEIIGYEKISILLFFDFISMVTDQHTITSVNWIQANYGGLHQPAKSLTTFSNRIDISLNSPNEPLLIANKFSCIAVQTTTSKLSKVKFKWNGLCESKLVFSNDWRLSFNWRIVFAPRVYFEVIFHQRIEIFILLIAKEMLLILKM